MKKKLRLAALVVISLGLSTFGLATPSQASTAEVIECSGCSGCDLVVNGKHIPIYRIPC